METNMPTLIIVPVGNGDDVRYSIEKLEKGRVYFLARTNMNRKTERKLYNERAEAEAAVKRLEVNEDRFFENQYLYYTETVTAYSLKAIPRFQGASA